MVPISSPLDSEVKAEHHPIDPQEPHIPVARVWHHPVMATEQDDIRRILRLAGEPLWASQVTERLNKEIGATVFFVDQIARRLNTMEDVRCLPDGRWELT